MKPADKAYMELGRERPDPNPADEVFASVKLLIAIVAVVGVLGMLFAAWWGKL